MKITESQLRTMLEKVLAESASQESHNAQVSSGVKEEGKKSQKMPRGYKAKKGTARGEKLRQLTKRYQDALKTPGKADDMAAMKARDAYEKSIAKKPGFKKRKSKYTEGEIMNEDNLRQIIREMIISERKLSKKTRTALKNKAEKHNAPLGALTSVYRKGMGAFYTSGSRPGMGAHQWAMARVNSFLKGGKARQVDASDWEKVKKHRKKKRKKK